MKRAMAKSTPRFVATLALFAALPVAASQAACSKPETPACALERVPFASDGAADDCRKAMLAFRDVIDVYAGCLGETSQDDEKAARDAYEDVRMRFNRRARGETD